MTSLILPILKYRVSITFFNQKKEEPTEENIKIKMNQLTEEVNKFRSKNRLQQEATASAYTVLVDSKTEGIQIF